MELSKNKKGAFFTFIAILMVGLIVYSANVYDDIYLRQQSVIVEDRVRVMSNFLDDIEKDIARGLYISSFRALFNEINYITEVKGDYVDDYESVFLELLLNGSIEGNTSVAEWVKDNTFMNWTDKIKKEASSMEMRLNMTLEDIDVRHDNPWHVTVEINLSIFLDDSRKIANWSVRLNERIRIDIVNFEDPIYSISTKGDLYNFITRSNRTDFVDGEDTDELEAHARTLSYIRCNRSPSFLKRLEGDFGADINGIESLVDPNFYEARTGISITEVNKSLNDFIFFDKTVLNDTGCFVNNSPSWLKINQSHLDIYEAEDLGIC